MHLLTTPRQIESALCKLIQKYEQIQFASAWASNNSLAFDMLMKNTSKIYHCCVGIHFYQTHPEFIKAFLNSDHMRFKTDPKGIFHSKVYLFSNSENEWECLIGSANFTAAAMQKNTEMLLHFNSNDSQASNIFTQLSYELERYWSSAQIFNDNDYNRYKSLWNKKLHIRSHLADEYSQESPGKPAYKSNIMTLSWSQFYKRAKNDKYHSFEIRLELLKKAHEYFQTWEYKDMPEEYRKQIAGIVKYDRDNPELDWMYFGHMASPRFKNRISDEYVNISKALKYIPMEGDVTKEHYLKYIEYFQKHENYGYGVPTTSRILAMIRPDMFFCLTGANEKMLYDDFGIKKIGRKEYEHYWDDIIERIKNSKWWDIGNKPQKAEEIALWNNRAAMLDAILYDGDLFSN